MKGVRFPSAICHQQSLQLCRFLGRLRGGAVGVLGCQASEKRQCTKSRDVVVEGCCGLYGVLSRAVITGQCSAVELPACLTGPGAHLAAMMWMRWQTNFGLTDGLVGNRGAGDERYGGRLLSGDKCRCSCSVRTSSWGSVRRLRRRTLGRASRFAARLESLDDDHFPAAAWAWMGGYLRPVRVWGTVRLRLRRVRCHAQ